ncbi:MAG: UDP-3-O-acyl-N-acetylglucosamine deacetylase [Pseudomonadota bacterium]
MAYTVSPVQHTIADRIDLSGIGVHSGEKVSLSLLPADANSGINFVRTDLPAHQQTDIPAVSSAVAATDLCTVLGDPSGAHVKTVEHLMAALMGMGVDNVLVEVDNPEIPVLDGSSEEFVDAILAVGLKAQGRTRRRLRVLREVHVPMGNSWGTFTPHDCPRFEVEIDFDDEVIGRQSYAVDLTPDSFAKDISRARTFGFMKDVESYWAAGFALGSSLENSVVIGEDNAIINPEGLRYENEFVRHKLLDAVGDLALAGAPIVGCFQSYRGGHKLNAIALEALLSDPDNYEWIGEEVVTGPRTSRVELVSVKAPAFAPDKS